MTACKEFDLLLPLHADGALEAEEAARVEAHLAACAACRAELAADRDVLALAKLPPVSDPERRAVAEAAHRTVAEVHRKDRRRSGGRQVFAGALVAAAAAVAILAPAVMRHGPEIEAPPAETMAAARAWEPDLETLWEDAGLVEVEGAFEATVAGSDAALAALEL